MAVVTAAYGLLVAVPAPAQANPDNCPPACDRIPESGWIGPTAIPLFSTYRWPGLAGVAVTAQAPRLRFEELCATSAALGDARSYAVAAKAAVGNSPGHWQLHAQVMHWRGETWLGGQIADATLRSAAAALRACQQSAPESSPSITTDEPGRLAAVISGAGPTPHVLHEYLVSHPQSSTVTELALWATSPPAVPWPVVNDQQVFDAMIAPLCVAYIGSCQ
jgi:hypothetical protein